MKNNNKYFLGLLIIVLLGILIWYFRIIVIYLIIATVLSLIGQPLVRLFGKIKAGRFSPSSSLCALGAMFTLTSALLLIVSFFIPLISEEIRILSSVNPQQVLESLQEPLAGIKQTMDRLQPGSSNTVQLYLQEKLTSFFSFNQVSFLLGSLISFTGDIFVALFAISFITFFFLKDEQLVYNTILLITPSKHASSVKNILRDTKKLLSRYFIGLCIESILVIVLISIGLSVLGIQNAFIIALFLGIMNIIPYVGPLIGAAFGIMVCISTNLDMEFYTELLPLISQMCLVFIAVQVIDGMIIQPMIFSNTVKAHPLEIFIVLLAAGNIGGIIGMIAAIPVYTMFRVIAREFLNNFKLVQKLTENIKG